MKDRCGREIVYMRISITDRCNLRCSYCMPHGVEWIPMEEILSYEEIAEVCREAVSLGIRRFKITGGEPLVRLGCEELIRMLKDIPGTQQVTLTTNGVLLYEKLPGLLAAGLDAVNVSLDTLDEKKYREITGFSKLSQVLEGLDAALASPIRVKVNAVLQRGMNDGEWEELLLLAKDRPLDVRFIEIMPIGQGRECRMVSNEELFKRIREAYPGVEADRDVHGNGPAVYCRIPGFAGSVGFISAIHGKFCASCNRIRMTATGELKPCLCHGESLSLREALRAGEQAAVRETLAAAIAAKPDMHCFEQVEEITEQKKMAQIGG